MLMAWGDESQSNRALDPWTYILASAIAFDDDVEAMRGTMRQLLTPGKRKVHWHQDDATRRRRVVEQIAQLPVEGFVVVRTVIGDRGERSRRKCLEVMLEELGALGCTSLTLESRGSADDRRDVQMVRFLQRRQHPGASVRLEHEVGPKEPLLWIADALCGAVMTERCGDPTYLQRLSTTVEVKVVDP